MSAREKMGAGGELNFRELRHSYVINNINSILLIIEILSYYSNYRYLHPTRYLRATEFRNAEENEMSDLTPE